MGRSLPARSRTRPDRSAQAGDAGDTHHRGASGRQAVTFPALVIAKEFNYSIVDANGKTIKLTRVSESTLRKRYRTGLNTFWKFLIDNGYALRTQSSEWAQPVYLSIARADYLYSVAYLRTQYDAGLKLAT